MSIFSDPVSENVAGNTVSMMGNETMDNLGSVENDKEPSGIYLVSLVSLTSAGHMHTWLDLQLVTLS